MQQHRNEEASLEMLEQKTPHNANEKTKKHKKCTKCFKKTPQETTKIKNPLK
jgi:hypothetical protein